jgi:hypothetical protein
MEDENGCGCGRDISLDGCIEHLGNDESQGQVLGRYVVRGAPCLKHFGECSAIAVYGFDPTPDNLAAFFGKLVEHFRHLGFPPDSIGVLGPRYGNRPGPFAVGEASLIRRRFQNVKALEFSALEPEARVPVNDYLLTAAYSAKYSYALFAARSSIVPWVGEVLFSIMQDIISCLNPEYGIGYTRAHQFGPAMYAMGINQGLKVFSGPEYEEACEASDWATAMKQQVYNRGLLRDVYPWNFLSSTQLARSIGDQTLEQWIRDQASRGRLSPMEGKLTFWEVASNELTAIRKTLKTSGVIYDWRRQS